MTISGFVCAYRHPIVDNIEWDEACEQADNHSVLKKYLKSYEQSFYDWGDDPAFFAAQEFLGDVRKVSWGVCRPDLRKNIQRGDFTVFFCGKEFPDGLWKYYYIGLGTIRRVIKNRSRIYKSKRLVRYRQFFNLIVDAEGRHDEKIREHEKWKELADTPYLIFESSSLTHFNLTKPLLVADYRKTDTSWQDGALEKWNLSNDRVQRIYELIPTRAGGEKLCASRTGYAHRHMNLGGQGLDNCELKRTRRHLLSISREIADKEQR